MLFYDEIWPDVLTDVQHPFSFQFANQSGISEMIKHCQVSYDYRTCKLEHKSTQFVSQPEENGRHVIIICSICP